MSYRGNRTIWCLFLALPLSLISSPAGAHTPASTDNEPAGMLTFYVSAQLSSPAHDVTYIVNRIDITSASNHMVWITGPGGQVTVDYEFKLTRSGQTVASTSVDNHLATLEDGLWLAGADLGALNQTFPNGQNYSVTATAKTVYDPTTVVDTTHIHIFHVDA